MLSQNFITLFFFLAVLLLFLGLYTVIREWAVHRARIRSRLAPEKQKSPSRTELASLRQSRSLTAEGHYSTALVSLNKLILQSGTSLGLNGVFLVGAACAGVVFFTLYLTGFTTLWLIIPTPVAAAILFPVLLLRFFRNRRQRRFEAQLPEAIDTIVRGLKAGHSIAVAIASVARNLPDPTGGEFRLAAAEMTYGLDLETAMINLQGRVGQSDLSLVTLAVSIQSKTGGNLAEVLANLSHVIRERFKLKRKAHALTAEGRFSGLVLSILPILLFGVIWIVSPNYYRDVWDVAYTKPILFGAVLWMFLGDYIIHRMVKIRV